MEPALGPTGKLKTARKGVGRFVVKVIGKASHAGLAPEEGISAILELSHVVQSLFALNDAEKGITVNVGTIDGGLRPNVIAPEASAEADVRVATHDDAREIEQAIYGLQSAVPGTRLEVSGRVGRPPMEKTPGNQQLWRLAQEAADEMKIPIDEGTAGGGSDGNYTSLHAPTLDGMGAVGDGAHALTEFVFVDKMPERCGFVGPNVALTQIGCGRLAHNHSGSGDPAGCKVATLPFSRVSNMSRQRPIFASLTRISDLEENPFAVEKIPRDQWATGDYVIGRVSTHVCYGPRIELANGRMMEIAHGDDLVGAFGVRAATLEAVGSWQAIGDDGVMQALTGAGLIGRATSVSPHIRTLLDLDYQGHVVRSDKKVTMKDFVKPVSGRRYDIPTVFIIGTSMSAGKTTVGKVIVRELSRAGLRVAGVKLTGAGRYRDILGHEMMLERKSFLILSTEVCHRPSVLHPSIGAHYPPC